MTGMSFPVIIGARATPAMASRKSLIPIVLKDPTRSLLSSYLHGNTTVFHCPGDKRTGFTRVRPRP